MSITAMESREGEVPALFRALLFLVIVSLSFTAGCKEDWSARLGARTLWQNCAHPFPSYPLERLKQELEAHPPRMSFAVMGNTDLAPGEGSGQDEEPVLGRIMEDLLAIRPRPGFIFHLGDIAREPGDERAWEALRREVAPFRVGFFEGAPYDPGRPHCFVLPGERDVADTESERAFLQFFFPSSAGLPFSFDWNEFHFIALNSERTDDSWLMRYFGFNRRKNRIAGEQREWLQRDLEENRGKKIVVFIHKPLFSPVFSSQDEYCLEQYYFDRERLLGLLKSYSVKAAFLGHEPLFHWARIEETCHIISGGAGRDPKAPNRFGGFHHFLYVTIDQASRMKVYCLDPLEDKVRNEIEIS